MSVRTRFRDGGGAYLLLDGSRAMIDDLNLGGNDINSVNIVNCIGVAAGTSGITSSGHIKGLASGVTDIGITAQEFRDLYLKGKVKFASLLLKEFGGKIAVRNLADSVYAGMVMYEISLNRGLAVLSSGSIPKIKPYAGDGKKWTLQGHTGTAFVDVAEFDDDGLRTLNRPFGLTVFTDATRGAAGTAGRVIFNSDDGQINIDDGTNWTLPDGSIT